MAPSGLTASIIRRAARNARLLGLLAIQFLVGMAVNLYVKLPSAGGAMTEMMGSGPLVMLHMTLGNAV